MDNILNEAIRVFNEYPSASTKPNTIFIPVKDYPYLIKELAKPIFYGDTGIEGGVLYLLSLVCIKACVSEIVVGFCHAGRKEPIAVGVGND